MTIIVHRAMAFQVIIRLKTWNMSWLQYHTDMDRSLKSDTVTWLSPSNLKL